MAVKDQRQCEVTTQHASTRRAAKLRRNTGRLEVLHSSDDLSATMSLDSTYATGEADYSLVRPLPRMRMTTTELIGYSPPTSPVRQSEI